MKTIPLAIAMLVVPLAAEAKPKPKSAAKPHIEKATKAHKAGNFQLALSELETAYSIDPQPKLLYAIAQTHAKLDNCPQAITYYEKYLATVADKAKQEVVKEAIASCKGKPAAAPEKADDKDALFRKHKGDEPVVDEAKAEPEPAPPPPAPEPAKPPEPAPPPPPVKEATPPPAPAAPPALAPAPVVQHKSHWYADVLGDALVVAGVGAGVGGLVLYTGALSDLDAAEKSTTIGDYKNLVDSAHHKQTYSIILGGGGIALVAVGILRYAMRDTGESHAVAVVPTSGGGLITLSGGF